MGILNIKMLKISSHILTANHFGLWPKSVITIQYFTEKAQWI